MTIVVTFVDVDSGDGRESDGTKTRNVVVIVMMMMTTTTMTTMISASLS